jgi:hypothetical protein
MGEFATGWICFAILIYTSAESFSKNESPGSKMRKEININHRVVFNNLCHKSDPKFFANKAKAVPDLFIFCKLQVWKYIITRIPKEKSGFIISGNSLCCSWRLPLVF